MSYRKLIHFHLRIPLLIALGTSLPANACGPDLPNRLLINRNTTLLYMPEGNYAFEASRLIPVDEKLPRWKAPAPSTTASAARPSFEDETFRQIRASLRLEDAEILSASLSPATRLYSLGAVAFRLRDDRAADYFREVLALPPPAQGTWGLAARYSLGRALMEDYPSPADDPDRGTALEGHADEADLRLAQRTYEQLIEDVRGGQPDPERLSLSALGQLGRIALWLNDPVAAARRYAQQVAQGDPSGGDSLRYLSRYLIKPENAQVLQRTIDEPLIQQLVTIELFTRRGIQEFNRDNQESGEQALIELLGKHLKTGFAGIDRLAALAYRSGQYALAEMLLKNADDSGLVWWLRAKMALRHNDVAMATASYAKAAATFPSDESWGLAQANNEIIVPACRVAGEQATLSLYRGDFLQAMELMFKARDIYWADVADIAERVLTLNELITFVNRNASAPTAPPNPAPPDTYNPEQMTPTLKLRALLARRLVRAGRYREAIKYFDPPNVRQSAQKLAEQVKRAGDLRQNKLSRAQNYYQAAMLLRYEGLTLAAYEMTPDYAIYDAGYSWIDDAFDAKGLESTDWINAAEQTRAKKALPPSGNRFLQYRWRAVALAEKAADLLPPKSLAYAAVLCRAASWVIQRDPHTGSALYRRYLVNGTRYDWAPKFGYTCPEPVFGAAKRQKIAALGADHHATNIGTPMYKNATGIP